MEQLLFEQDCPLTAEERYLAISQMFRDNQILIVEFRKKSGELRTMECTLDSSLLPPADAADLHQTRLIDWETKSVWDMEKTAWRSFKTMNVISVKVKND